MVAVGRACGLVGALVAIVPAVGHAGNGLNPIGFGLESNAMGGADLAVARDPFALGTNPAGIAQLHGLNLELHGGAARELGIRHEDQFNADAGLRNEYVPEVNFGVTDQLGPYPICVGLNLAATGGGGYDYGRIATPFGNEDRLSSLFGIVRASVGAATYVASGVAVGASFGLSYARLDQDFFSDTSVLDAADPSRSFFGTKIEAGQAIGTGFRLGALWQVSDRLTFGAAYGSKVELPIESGRLDVNMSAQGLGKVQYDDLKLKGLAQAQELGVGASYRITPRWLVAADLAWLNWSDALTTTTLRARDPDNSAAPAVLRTTSVLDWRDQYVVSVGTAYQPIEPVTLWGGYNYGRNPIPNEHLSPLLANIGEHTLTAGAAWRVRDDLRLGCAVEYLVPTEVTYDNPDLPFGPSKARQSYVALHLGLDWRL